jgi:metallo-beta-lactamase class B
MRRLALWGLAIGLLAGGALVGQTPTQKCAMCPEWNKPQTPFVIYGNTYYVGPHGLGSILITSPQGDVLIDGALAESAPMIAANIKALGFKIEDVKLILTTHVHFDHAGGVAELQRLSGAKVVASPWSAAVLKSGEVAKDDPQYGDIHGIDPVANVSTLHDGETLKVGPLAVTAHSTPGHTAGGTSWTWTSCEAGRCLRMVYADSISSVSADGFKFTEHPKVVAQFEKSFSFFDTVPCDILLTPHGEASQFWDRMDAHRKGTTPGPLIDPDACRKLAANARAQLQKRLDTERGVKAPGI